MSDLEVPEEAYVAAQQRFAKTTDEGDLLDAIADLNGVVDAAAALIVAAELRRMAAAADAQLREAEAAKDRGTAGGPRYPELYARAAAVAFHRDELNARADELEAVAP